MPDKSADVREENARQKYGPKATLAQTFATTAQSLLLMGVGMNFSMPALVIRDLYHGTDGEFSITTSEASWYGSLIVMVHPVGCFLSGLLQDKIGKKNCMFFANIPSIFAWILLYNAHSAVVLYASTLLMGFSTGLGAGSSSSYVGEIAEPRLRGPLGLLGSTVLRIGSLITFLMGSFLDWRTVALFSAFGPVVCMCLISCIPESPVWLVAKGKPDKAEKAMCWLRGWVKPEAIKPEFLELVRYNEVSGTKCDKDGVPEVTGVLGKLLQLKNPSVYRPLRLMTVVFFISYIGSLFPTRPFITKIMKTVDLTDNQNESLVALQCLTIMGALTSTVIIHRVGKRLLAMLTLLINTILMFSFGAHIIAFKHDCIPSYPWISLAILCCIYYFGACGISCIPWVFVIEVFPNKSRDIATGACTGLSYILLFTLTKSYLSIEMYLSLEYTMILFGGLGVLGLIFFYFCVPETDNKTLLEIEEYFVPKSNK